MANLYVKSTGSATAPYDTWAKAATNPATAVNAAAAGDTVYIHQEDFTIGTDTTWTLAGTVSNPVRVICSNDAVNEPPQTLGTSKYTQNANAWDLTVNGIGYIYGFSFEQTGVTANAPLLNLIATDDDFIVWENGGYSITSTSSTAKITIGAVGENSSKMIFKDFSVTMGAAGQSITVYQPVEWYGGSITSTANPTSMFVIAGRSGSITVEGVDFSGLPGGTIIAPASQLVNGYILLKNCKLSSSASTIGSYTGINQGEVDIFNCSTGDQHYKFENYNYLGSLLIDTGIYANDGASYDGTNKCSWKITTTSYTSYANPYISPWVEKYHSGTSAITPYFEILRDGSTTAYQDDEVWGEWSYQGTASSTKASFTNDRRTVLGTPANQAAGVGLSGWTGEAASAWSGKLAPGSTITPAEIGMLMGRVYVGEPSITVYVDPKIRT
jgi:hypothetical protein